MLYCSYLAYSSYASNMHFFSFAIQGFVDTTWLIPTIPFPSVHRPCGPQGISDKTGCYKNFPVPHNSLCIQVFAIFIFTVLLGWLPLSCYSDVHGFLFVSLFVVTYRLPKMVRPTRTGADYPSYFPFCLVRTQFLHSSPPRHCSWSMSIL